MYRITVEPIIFFYMLSLQMLLPALQDLIYVKVCLGTYSLDVCENLYIPENKKALDDVETWSSHWILASTLALALPAIVTSQYLGSWSDMYGRKIPLLIPPLGATLASIVYIGMSSYLHSWPVSLSLLASVISGVSGGFASCILTCTSYITHVSDLNSRTYRVGILEAMNFVGGTLGPLLTSWIQDGLGRPSTFIFIMALNALAVIYTIIFVRSPQMRHPPPEGSWKIACRFKHLKNSLLTIFRRREENRRTCILLLIVSFTIMLIIFSGELDTIYIFVKDTPIEWNLTEFTRFSAIKNFLGTFGLLVLLPICRGFSDTVLMGVGFTFRIVYYFLLGFSTGPVPLYIAACIWTLGSWCSTSIRSSLSKLVEREEQGKLFASLAIVESCATLIGTALFNSFYPASRSFFKGLLFVTSACALFISLGITCYLHKFLKVFSNYVQVEDDFDESHSTVEEPTADTIHTPESPDFPPHTDPGGDQVPPASV